MQFRAYIQHVYFGNSDVTLKWSIHEAVFQAQQLNIGLEIKVDVRFVYVTKAACLLFSIEKQAETKNMLAEVKHNICSYAVKIEITANVLIAKQRTSRTFRNKIKCQTDNELVKLERLGHSELVFC